jgi:uncharacterized protein YkwD
MINALNALRAVHGVGPLRPSPTLGRSAAGFSQWMLTTGTFGHLDRGAYLKAGQRFGCFGEVLSRHPGRRPRIKPTLRAWKRSDPHRAVLLSTAYRWVGAGQARGLFNGLQTTLWTVRVGCTVKG